MKCETRTYLALAAVTDDSVCFLKHLNPSQFSNIELKYLKESVSVELSQQYKVDESLHSGLYILSHVVNEDKTNSAIHFCMDMDTSIFGDNKSEVEGIIEKFFGMKGTNKIEVDLVKVSPRKLKRFRSRLHKQKLDTSEPTRFYVDQ